MIDIRNLTLEIYYPENWFKRFITTRMNDYTSQEIAEMLNKDRKYTRNREIWTANKINEFICECDLI